MRRYSLDRILLVIAAVSSLQLTTAFVVPSAVNVQQKSHYLFQPLHASSITTSSSINAIDDHETTSFPTVTFWIPQDSDAPPTQFGKAAPVDAPSIRQAVQQLAQKCVWFADGKLQTHILTIHNSEEDDDHDTKNILLNTNVLIAFGLSNKQDLQHAHSIFQQRLQNTEQHQASTQCQFAIDCTQHSAFSLDSFVGPFNPQNLLTSSLPATLFPWSQPASGKRFQQQMTQLFHKYSSDEFVFGILIFLNQFSGHSIDWVKHSIDATWEKGPLRNAQEVSSMVSQCGDCITACVQDETCKACLDKLQEYDTRDQVASYRTIVSFESQLLADFSYCILQKNNIFHCDATIPTMPSVPPMATFRGQPMTTDIARGILIGHLEGQDEESLLFKSDASGTTGDPVSWMVACGGNEAYDKFPSQHQIFYPTANKNNHMWYDPVFRVETLDGRHVWCKRHYAVRPQSVPATFRFSVLDNGITSDEFWTIVDCEEENLDWIVFHYAGAARAVGQRYLGGLVCTRTGALPEADQLPRVWKACRAAGIEPWELYCVDNDTQSKGYLEAGEPPLDFFRKKVMAKRIPVAQ